MPHEYGVPHIEGYSLCIHLWKLLREYISRLFKPITHQFFYKMHRSIGITFVNHHHIKKEAMKNAILTLLSLCILTSIHAQESYKDCATSEQVIELGHYRYNEIAGNGEHYERLGKLQDGAPLVESNSVWLMWEIEEGGEFVFEITPFDDRDDMDFVLYKSDGNCDSKEKIRACLSGDNVYTKSSSEPCSGSTGLSYSSIDDYEDSGCYEGDDNYVRSVVSKTGDIYFLVINNYYQETGFWFDIKGDITMSNPDNAVQFGKLILENMSVYPNPTSDFIQVELHDESFNVQNIQVIDGSGKLLRTISSPQPTMRINVNDLSAGNYFIIAQGEKDIMRMPFIKQ